MSVGKSRLNILQLPSFRRRRREGGRAKQRPGESTLRTYAISLLLRILLTLISANLFELQILVVSQSEFNLFLMYYYISV